MRYFAKITTTFALALVFSAGMAFGQSNSSTTIDQDDDNNTANVTQPGDNNRTFVKQSGDATNTAIITQTLAKDNNTVRLNQKGGAYADINVRGGNATVRGYDDSRVNQTNSGAGANVLTLRGNKGAGSNSLYGLDQLSGGNTIDIDITGGVANETIKVLQKSAGNTTRIDFQDQPFVDVQQKGNGGHTALIDTDMDAGGGVKNQVVVEQTGQNDLTMVDQFGNNNVAKVDQ